MNLEDKIAKLESDIKLLRMVLETRTDLLSAENQSRHDMIMAACEEINVVHKRVDETERRLDDAEHRLGVVKYILDEIGG